MKYGKGGSERLSKLLEVTQVLIPGPTDTKGQDVVKQQFEPSSSLYSHWLFCSTVVLRNHREGEEQTGKMVRAHGEREDPEKERGKHYFQIKGSMDTSLGGLFRKAFDFGPLMPLGKPCPTHPSVFSSLGV